MTKLFANLFLACLLVFAACSSPTEDTAAEAETAMETTTAPEAKGPLPEPETLTENYQTVVLKGDIPSPQKRMSGTIDEATVSVTYGSPSMRGRKIWGGLEPYGEVWRTGANEATVFEVDKAVKVEGQELPAGKYALFTIPNEGTAWTVIFNKVHQQWGAYEYSEAEDALRVEVEPVKLDEARETLEFVIDGNKVAMQWSDVHLPFEVSAG